MMTLMDLGAEFKERASTLAYKARCPRCAARGKDRSGDNLGVYNDGHEFCFACKFYTPATLESRLKTKVDLPVSERRDVLPFDATVNIPTEIIRKLFEWGLNLKHIKQHHLMWSDSKKSVVIPVYGDNHTLLMYQLRTFEPGKPKYLTFGFASDILHVIRPKGTTDNGTIILVEDIFSAIRVGEHYNCMPLWGNNIPLKLIKRLAGTFSTMGIWLDPDMRVKAVKDALYASQYIPTFVVHSDNDPKAYTDDAIREHVDVAGYEILYKDKMTKKDYTLKYEDSGWKGSPCVADSNNPCPGRGEGCCKDQSYYGNK